MKFLIFGDMHERNNKPSNRIDDWDATIDNKVAEILEIAKQEGVTALLQPGDFLDKPQVGAELEGKIINRWVGDRLNNVIKHGISGMTDIKASSEMLKELMPVIGVIGNHEMIGGNLKAYERTSVNVLEKTGMFIYVKKDKPLIITDPVSKKTIAITGSDYTLDIDTDKERTAHKVSEKLGDVHIHIVHAMGTTTNFGTLFAHTLVESVADTKADLTIYGHDHIGFDPVEIDGKMFVNPGSVTRLTASKAEMARQPKVMILEIDEQGKVSLKAIPLKSALDSKKVLSRAKIESDKNIKEKMNEIKEIVADAVGKSEHHSIVEIIREIAASSQLDIESQTDLLTMIDNRMVRDDNTQAVEEYYIKTLELTNFQSHSNTVLELSKGVNAFVGESRSGKSAILRSLRWIYENNAKDARRFIKTNSDFASVKITLSNDVTIERVVYKKKTGFNGYIVTKPNEEPVKYNTKASEVIQSILGFHDLKLDKDKSIPVNFLIQGASWYFIGDSMTGQDRAKAIGSIYDIHHVDSVIKELEAKNKADNLVLKEKVADREKLRVESSCMNYLTDMANDIGKAEKLLEEIELLQAQIDTIERAKANQQKIDKAIVNVEKIITDLKDIDTCGSKARTIKIMSDELVRGIRLSNKWKSVIRHGKIVGKISKDLSMVDGALLKVNELKDINNKLQVGKKLSNKQLSVNLAINKIELINKDLANVDVALNKCGVVKTQIANVSHETKLCDKYKSVVKHGKTVSAVLKDVTGLIDKGSEKVESIIKYRDDVNKVKTAKVTIENNEKEQSLLEVSIKETDSNVKKLKLEYMDKMSHVEHCPLCLNKITKEQSIAIAKEKFN